MTRGMCLNTTRTRESDYACIALCALCVAYSLRGCLCTMSQFSDYHRRVTIDLRSMSACCNYILSQCHYVWTDVVKFSTTCPAQDYKRLVLRGRVKSPLLVQTGGSNYEGCRQPLVSGARDHY